MTEFWQFCCTLSDQKSSDLRAFVSVLRPSVTEVMHVSEVLKIDVNCSRILKG